MESLRGLVDRLCGTVHPAPPIRVNGIASMQEQMVAIACNELDEVVARTKRQAATAAINNDKIGAFVRAMREGRR